MGSAIRFSTGWEAPRLRRLARNLVRLRHHLPVRSAVSMDLDRPCALHGPFDGYRLWDLERHIPAVVQSGASVFHAAAAAEGTTSVEAISSANTAPGFLAALGRTDHSQHLPLRVVLEGMVWSARGAV